ncbi:MAG TPA: NADH-quinone oxidoreductase subunit J, partial [Pseudomonas sp.]|nr:NADH-quinone oxidoreductase subunit J [Pseudomonas sp.]
VGGWAEGLAIRLRLTPVAALLLLFTALLHLLVALYATRIAHAAGGEDFWPLSCLLQAALAALWLSADLFNLYVTLELLALCAVALVALAGDAAWKPALNYLLLSLA